MQRLIFIFSLFILAIVGCSSNESHSFLIRPDGGGEDAATEIEVGKTIPAWQEGVMDIHFINTTTGESMFVIFPDGTQMLIDAASSSVTTNSNSNTTNTGIRSRWDPTLTSTRGSQIITWSIVCHCRHIERIVIIGIATIEKRTNLEIVENLGKTYQRISVGVGRFRQGRSITAEVVIMEVGKYGIINRAVTCPYHTLTNVISYNL